MQGSIIRLALDGLMTAAHLAYHYHLDQVGWCRDSHSVSQNPAGLSSLLQDCSLHGRAGIRLRVEGTLPVQCGASMHVAWSGALL